MTDYTSSPYYNAAVADAAKYGVPPALFVWQIGQESSFDPAAQNGNATGIAQFMPATAAQFGINPHDPTQSLDAAARYDAQLYAQTGDWVSALTRYGTIDPNKPATLAGARNALANPSSGSNASFWGGLLGAAANPLGAVTSAMTPGTGANALAQTAGQTPLISWITSVIANYWLIIIGSILALGALLMSQHQTIVNTGKTVAKTAALLG